MSVVSPNGTAPGESESETVAAGLVVVLLALAVGDVAYATGVETTVAGHRDTRLGDIQTRREEVSGETLSTGTHTHRATLRTPNP